MILDDVTAIDLAHYLHEYLAETNRHVPTGLLAAMIQTYIAADAAADAEWVRRATH